MARKIMKVFLRVVVTVLILCGLGFGTYFIFFKPANEDVVFLKLSQMMEYKDYQGNSYSANRRIDEKIGIVRTGRRNDSAYKDSGIIISDGSTIEIYLEKYYKLLDNNGNISCVEIDEQLTNVYNYYFAYTQASKKVKKSVQNDMQKAIDTYLKAYDELNEKLNKIISLQNVINELIDEETDLKTEDSKPDISEENKTAIKNQIIELRTRINSYAQELSDRYLLAVNKYRACLREYTDLILKVKDFVINYVFDGESATDKDVVKNDIYLYVVQQTMKTDVQEDGKDITVINENTGLNNIKTFSNIDMSSVKVAEAGSVLFENKLYMPTIETKTTEIEYVMIGNICYRKMKDYYWYKCDPNTFECDLGNKLNYENFTIETEEDEKYLTNGDDRYKICTYTKTGETYRIIEIGNTNYRKNGDKWYKCDKLSTDIYYSSLSFLNCTELTESRYYGSTYTGNLYDLRSSKLVEHYNFIIDGGYLDNLKKVLSSDKKSDFMSESSAISEIPKICENSIRYILACYGFSA